MRTLSAPVLAALASPVVPIVQLIKLEFPGVDESDHSNWQLLNTSNWHLVWDGDTYRGAAGMGTIQPIEDAPGEVRGLQFDLAGVAASAIAMALDGSDEWQGCPVTIYTAIFDPATYQILDACVEWSGLGDTMSIKEDGEKCFVQATAESSAVDLLRGVPLTYSDADQQALFPGDLAFQYVVSQNGQPVVWPAREYFLK